MSKPTKLNSIRLISGQWRGRLIPVINSQGLRPTTNRVRETLFNWLMYDIPKSRCLDLFAGSGALGFEALSRGAEFVQFVDSNPLVVRAVQDNIELLKINQDRLYAQVLNKNSLDYLEQTSPEPFDLVFLDPPFGSEFIHKVIELLVTNHWLNKHAMVYIEQNSKEPYPEVPQDWVLYRQGQAGQSRYLLYHCTRE